jgi:preprotein translocase subunit SecD
MRRAVLAAAFAAIAFTGIGCDHEGERALVKLKAVPPPGHELTSEDLDRSVEIMQRRLDKLGVDGDVRREDAGTMAVELPAGTRLPDGIERRGLLEFYDLEAALRGPSVTRGLVRAPIAKPAPPAAVPPNTTVVSCEVATGACLSTRPLTTQKVFYLFNSSPARREAQRGAVACAGRRDSAAVLSCGQHFAIVLDHELVSAPYIDFVRNPDGIPADNGMQIEVDSLRAAKRIAIAIQTGALPVQFVRLP